MSKSSTRPATGIFAPFEWMIAVRYLRAKRQESFISVISLFSLIGIALGVATLIIVMSVMNGFKVELLKSILGLSGHVTIQSQLGMMRDYDGVTARVRRVPGVVRAAPIVDGQVMASQGNANVGVIVRGMRAGDLAKTDILAGKLLPGALNQFQGDDVVIVGAGLAAKLGLRTGGEITLLAPKGNVTPFGLTPRVKSYHIISVFRVGNTLYDNNYIFMPLEEAQAYFNFGDTVSGVEVMLNDPESDIGQPIGLKDWNVQLHQAQAIRNDTHLSDYPARHFVLSTRDMASLGQLMLRQGRWGDRQVIPAAWVARTTGLATPAAEVIRTSPFVEGLGYGWLWWVFDPAGPWPDALKGAYTASGAFGQFITVVPALNMVVAHKVEAPSNLNVSPEDYLRKILPAALAFA